MEDWKIGDKCYIRMYGVRYGEGKFLVYEAKIIGTQGSKFIVEAKGMRALRAGYELYKTKQQALNTLLEGENI